MRFPLPPLQVLLGSEMRLGCQDIFEPNLDSRFRPNLGRYALEHVSRGSERFVLVVRNAMFRDVRSLGWFRIAREFDLGVDRPSVGQ